MKTPDEAFSDGPVGEVELSASFHLRDGAVADQILRAVLENQDVSITWTEHAGFVVRDMDGRLLVSIDSESVNEDVTSGAYSTESLAAKPIGETFEPTRRTERRRLQPENAEERTNDRLAVYYTSGAWPQPIWERSG